MLLQLFRNAPGPHRSGTNRDANDGDVGLGREIPVAGLLAGNVDASSTAIGLTLLWSPDWNLGEKWQYSMAATIPWVDIKVSAGVRDANGGPAVMRSDREKALGDIVLIPAMFNYNVNPDFNINMRLTVYVPSGRLRTIQVNVMLHPGTDFEFVRQQYPDDPRIQKP